MLKPRYGRLLRASTSIPTSTLPVLPPSFLLPSFHHPSRSNSTTSDGTVYSVAQFVEEQDLRENEPARWKESINKMTSLEPASSALINVDDRTTASSSSSSLPSTSTSSAVSSSLSDPSSSSSAHLSLPESRSELLRLLHDPPESIQTDSLRQLKRLRNHVKSLHRLDDTATISKLSTLGVSLNQDTFVRRLLKLSMDLIIDSYDPEPDKSEAKQRVARMLQQPMRKCRQLSKSRLLYSLTQAALNRRVRTLSILKNRLRALFELERYPQTIEDFSLFAKNEIEPDASCWDMLIGAHLHYSSVAVAQRVMKEKNKKGLETTAQTALILLEGLQTYGNSKPVEDRILNEPDQDKIEIGKDLSQDVRLLNKILLLKLIRKDIDSAFRLLNTHFDASDGFRNCIANLFEIDPVEPPDRHRSLFRPEPDLATRVILAKTLVLNQRPDLALRFIIHELPRVKTATNISDELIGLIVLCLTDSRTNGFSEARQLLADLPSGRARIELEDGFVWTFPRFTPSHLAFEALLSATLRNYGLSKARELLADTLVMNENDRLSISKGTFTILIEHLASQPGGVAKAAQFVVRLWEVSSDENKHDLSIRNVNALLFGSLNSSPKIKTLQPQAFLPVQFLPKDLAPSPSAKPPPTTLASSRILASLKAHCLRPDRTTSELLLESISPIHNPSQTSTKPMWDHLQTSVLDRGIRPSHRHLLFIIKAYLHLNDIAGALSALAKGLNHLGIQPHPSLYTPLIHHFTKIGQPERARTIYQELRRNELQPDQFCFVVLVIGFIRTRDFIAANIVLEEAKTLLPKGDKNPVLVGVEFRLRLMQTGFEDAINWLYEKVAKEKGVQIDQGMVALTTRTRRWFRRKLNQRKLGRLNAQVDWTDEQVEEMGNLVMKTDNFVRAQFRKSMEREEKGWREVKKLWTVGI